MIKDETRCLTKNPRTLTPSPEGELLEEHDVGCKLLVRLVRAPKVEGHTDVRVVIVLRVYDCALFAQCLCLCFDCVLMCALIELGSDGRMLSCVWVFAHSLRAIQMGVCDASTGVPSYQS